MLFIHVVAQLSLPIKNSINFKRLQVLCCFKLSGWLLCSLLLFTHAHADDDGLWSIAGLQVQSEGVGVQIRSDHVGIPGGYQIKDLAYRCPTSFTLFPLHSCAGASLSFAFNEHDYQAVLDTRFDFNTQNWALALQTPNQQLALLLDSEHSLSQLFLKDWQLAEAWQQLLPGAPAPTATFNGELAIDTRQLQVYTAAPMTFSGLDYEHSEDIIAVGLAGSLQLTLDVPESQLHFELSIDAGEMLVNQLYVDYAALPITVVGDLRLNQSGGYELAALIENQPALNLSVAAEISPELEWRSPTLHLKVIDSHHVNQQIFSSILGIYGFAGSDMSGQFELTVTSGAQDLDQWSISFDDYYFLNERRKIAVEALTGVLNWEQNAQAKDSQLAWRGLTLAGLPIHPSQIQFNWSQDAFALLGPHEFPVFDGGIELQSLELKALFSEFIDMSMNASIKPMSLKLITEKLGWAEMSGTISGDIPGMIKQGPVISFLGALNLSVFDGAMRVDNLSIERLFGVAPVIAADVSFEYFDLSLLTETFGFGLITGKLSGEVDQLRITNWKTDRLDAQIYTVKTKGIKQTISQRAIDNISSLGGIKGAVSKTFLRFFDDFRYQKIKLSCKLHNSVCQIGGLKNQGNQFVIVEGGGIPKINIVGFVRSINWEEFMDRLLNANYSN